MSSMFVWHRRQKGVWWNHWLYELAYYQGLKLQYASRSFQDQELLARVLLSNLIFKFTVASNNIVIVQLSFSMLLGNVN